MRYAGLAAAALAAVITIVAVLQWMPSSPKRAVATADVLYQSQIRGGFVPDHICTTDAEFIEYSRNVLGVPLLAQNDSSVQIVGWVYANRSVYRDLGVSEQARIILARVDGREVVVLLDPNDAAGPRLNAEAADQLRVFESNVAGVDLFEITPLDAPVVSRKFKGI